MVACPEASPKDQPRGSGPTGALLVGHVEVAHAARVIHGPGDGETQRGGVGQVEGDGGRDGVPDHGHGLGDDVTCPKSLPFPIPVLRYRELMSLF